jgi:hypothetical protein
MKYKTHFFLFVFVSLAFVSCKKQSSIEEYSEMLVTYPYSDTNAFPVIQNQNDIYP